VGPLLFILVFLIEGVRRPGYRPWRHFVSLLALGERGWIQGASFVVCGSLALGFALGVARALRSAPGGTALPMLIAIFGVALIASGRFPADPMLGYPPGSPTTWPPSPTRHSNLHNLAGLLAFTSIAAASFASARTSGGTAWGIYSITTGVVVLVLFVATGILAERCGRGALPDAPVGLIQRAAIVAGWTWLVALALHLM
jgi:hypothetical protein